MIRYKQPDWYRPALMYDIMMLRLYVCNTLMVALGRLFNGHCCNLINQIVVRNVKLT